MQPITCYPLFLSKILISTFVVGMMSCMISPVSGLCIDSLPNQYDYSSIPAYASQLCLNTYYGGGPDVALACWGVQFSLCNGIRGSDNNRYLACLSGGVWYPAQAPYTCRPGDCACSTPLASPYMNWYQDTNGSTNFAIVLGFTIYVKFVCDSLNIVTDHYDTFGSPQQGVRSLTLTYRTPAVCPNCKDLVNWPLSSNHIGALIPSPSYIDPDQPFVVVHRLMLPVLTQLETLCINSHMQCYIVSSLRSIWSSESKVTTASLHQVGGAIDFYVQPSSQTGSNHPVCGRDTCLKHVYDAIYGRKQISTLSAIEVLVYNSNFVQGLLCSRDQQPLRGPVCVGRPLGIWRYAPPFTRKDTETQQKVTDEPDYNHISLSGYTPNKVNDLLYTRGSASVYQQSISMCNYLCPGVTPVDSSLHPTSSMCTKLRTINAFGTMELKSEWLNQISTTPTHHRRLLQNVQQVYPYELDTTLLLSNMRTASFLQDFLSTLNLRLSPDVEDLYVSPEYGRGFVDLFNTAVDLGAIFDLSNTMSNNSTTPYTVNMTQALNQSNWLYTNQPTLLGNGTCSNYNCTLLNNTCVSLQDPTIDCNKIIVYLPANYNISRLKIVWVQPILMSADLGEAFVSLLSTDDVILKNLSLIAAEIPPLQYLNITNQTGYALNGTIHKTLNITTLQNINNTVTTFYTADTLTGYIGNIDYGTSEKYSRQASSSSSSSSPNPSNPCSSALNPSSSLSPSSSSSNPPSTSSTAGSNSLSTSSTASSSSNSVSTLSTASSSSLSFSSSSSNSLSTSSTAGFSSLGSSSSSCNPLSTSSTASDGLSSDTSSGSSYSIWIIVGGVVGICILLVLIFTGIRVYKSKHLTKYRLSSTSSVSSSPRASDVEMVAT